MKAEEELKIGEYFDCYNCSFLTKKEKVLTDKYGYEKPINVFHCSKFGNFIYNKRTKNKTERATSNHCKMVKNCPYHEPNDTTAVIEFMTTITRIAGYAYFKFIKTKYDKEVIFNLEYRYGVQGKLNYKAPSKEELAKKLLDLWKKSNLSIYTFKPI